MNRRQVLVTIGGLAATAGCITTSSATEPASTTTTTTTSTATTTSGETTATTASTTPESALDLPNGQVYDMGEEVQHDTVLVWPQFTAAENSVEYANPENGELETWRTDDDNLLLWAAMRAENLSNDSSDLPNWKNFRIVTPDTTASPRTEIADGTSVNEIRGGDYIPRVTDHEINGMRASGRARWSIITVIPTQPRRNVAVKWNPPNADPVYWRPGRH